jgi:hypothetical protein
MLESA